MYTADSGRQGIPVPQAEMGDWYRMCDELVEQDLMTDMEADLPLASGIRRKRPDGWAVHWSRRMLRILEFTRCNDYRQDWRETTEQYKPDGTNHCATEWLSCFHAAASTRMVSTGRKLHAGDTWLVCGDMLDSGTDGPWPSGVSEAAAEVAHLMAALVAQCLTELDKLYSTQAAALR